MSLNVRTAYKGLLLPLLPRAVPMAEKALAAVIQKAIAAWRRRTRAKSRDRYVDPLTGEHGVALATICGFDARRRIAKTESCADIGELLGTAGDAERALGIDDRFDVAQRSWPGLCRTKAGCEVEAGGRRRDAVDRSSGLGLSGSLAIRGDDACGVFPSGAGMNRKSRSAAAIM